MRPGFSVFPRKFHQNLQAQKTAPDGAAFSKKHILFLRTCGYKCLACCIAFVFCEVLDESAGQILCLGLPLRRISIGIAGIQDCRINTGELGRYFEVEVRDLLGGCILDIAIQDRIDDATGILNLWLTLRTSR